jgi:hypothetical protein
MTFLTIEIAGEDDRAAVRMLSRLFDLIVTSRSDDCELSTGGYTVSYQSGSAVCDVAKRTVDRKMLIDFNDAVLIQESSRLAGDAGNELNDGSLIDRLIEVWPELEKEVDPD